MPVLELLQSHPAVYLAVGALLLVTFVLSQFFSTRPVSRSSSPSAAEKGSRVKSSTSTFVTPTPPPYPDWDVHTTKPLPYRPFRYGPTYFITMGLRKMDWAEWIELDNEFLSYHAQKAERIRTRGHLNCVTAPEAYPAALELLDEFARFLPARYPSLFRRTAVGLDNIVTGESFNIVERPLKEDPMAIAARLVQDDLAIMMPSEPQPGGGGPGGDGRVYRLKAGATLLTGFWRLEDKKGMSMDEIHMSGDVPGYETKLKKGMNNFMARIKPGEAVCRNNYFIQLDADLPWSRSIGPEDQAGFGWFSAQEAQGVDQIHFRSERQSLRRLPKSGGVVFTIRTYFAPITELVKEPYVPGRLASAIRSWGEDVAQYKGLDRYERVLLPYLDAEHERQVREGLEVEKEEEVRKYPW